MELKLRFYFTLNFFFPFLLSIILFSHTFYDPIGVCTIMPAMSILVLPIKKKRVFLFYILTQKPILDYNKHLTFNPTFCSTNLWRMLFILFYFILFYFSIFVDFFYCLIYETWGFSKMSSGRLLSDPSR